MAVCRKTSLLSAAMVLAVWLFPAAASADPKPVFKGFHTTVLPRLTEVLGVHAAKTYQPPEGMEFLGVKMVFSVDWGESGGLIQLGQDDFRLTVDDQGKKLHPIGNLSADGRFVLGTIRSILKSFEREAGQAYDYNVIFAVPQDGNRHVLEFDKQEYALPAPTDAWPISREPPVIARIVEAKFIPEATRKQSMQGTKVLHRKQAAYGKLLAVKAELEPPKAGAHVSLRALEFELTFGSGYRTPAVACGRVDDAWDRSAVFGPGAKTLYFIVPDRLSRFTLNCRKLPVATGQVAK